MFQWLALWHLNWYDEAADISETMQKFQWLALWHLNWYQGGGAHRRA